MSQGRTSFIGVSTDRAALIQQARTWEGVPWKKIGDTRKGCNCVGFIVGVLRELRETELVERFEPYQGFEAPAHSTMLLEHLRKSLRRVYRARPGDVLLFRTGPGAATHVGLLVTSQTVMHVTGKTGKVCEARLHDRPSHIFEFVGID